MGGMSLVAENLLYPTELLLSPVKSIVGFTLITIDIVYYIYILFISFHLVLFLV